MGEDASSVEAAARPAKARHDAVGIVLIGACKFASGLLFAAAGFGIFHYLHRDLREVVERFVTLIHLDPNARLVQGAVAKVSGIDQRHLRELGLGTFFYAVLHLVEGTGLMLRRRWAECLTIVSTGSLIPVEGYVALKRMNLPKILVLLINIGFVIYLLVKLIQQHKAEARATALTAAADGQRAPEK